MVESGDLGAEDVPMRTPEAMPMELLQQTLGTRVDPETSECGGFHVLEPEPTSREVRSRPLACNKGCYKKRNA